MLSSAIGCFKSWSDSKQRYVHCALLLKGVVTSPVYVYTGVYSKRSDVRCALLLQGVVTSPVYVYTGVNSKRSDVHCALLLQGVVTTSPVYVYTGVNSKRSDVHCALLLQGVVREVVYSGKIIIRRITNERWVRWLEHSTSNFMLINVPTYSLTVPTLLTTVRIQFLFV